MVLGFFGSCINVQLYFQWWLCSFQGVFHLWFSKHSVWFCLIICFIQNWLIKMEVGGRSKGGGNQFLLKGGCDYGVFNYVQSMEYIMVCMMYCKILFPWVFEGKKPLSIGGISCGGGWEHLSYIALFSFMQMFVNCVQSWTYLCVYCEESM